LGDALENNWAEEYIADKKQREERSKRKNNEQQLKLTLENEEIEKVKVVDENFEKIWQSYEEMSKDKKIRNRNASI
jgi:hypothetical protein